MTILELIAALEALRAEHGDDAEVGIYMYAGGDDRLCYVKPEFSQEEGRVLLDTRYA